MQQQLRFPVLCTAGQLELLSPTLGEPIGAFMQRLEQYEQLLGDVQIGEPDYLGKLAELAIMIRDEIQALFRETHDHCADPDKFGPRLIEFWLNIIQLPLQDGATTLATAPFQKRLLGLAYNASIREIQVV